MKSALVNKIAMRAFAMIGQTLSVIGNQHD
jgi:hypothetical protein